MSEDSSDSQGRPTPDDLPDFSPADPLISDHRSVKIVLDNVQSLTDSYYKRGQSYRDRDTRLRVGAAGAAIAATTTAGATAALAGPAVALLTALLTGTSAFLGILIAITRPNDEAARCMEAHLDLQDVYTKGWAEWRKVCRIPDEQQRRDALVDLADQINLEMAAALRKHGERAAKLLRERSGMKPPTNGETR